MAQGSCTSPPPSSGSPQTLFSLITLPHDTVCSQRAELLAEAVSVQTASRQVLASKWQLGPTLQNLIGIWVGAFSGACGHGFQTLHDILVLPHLSCKLHDSAWLSPGRGTTASPEWQLLHYGTGRWLTQGTISGTLLGVHCWLGCERPHISGARGTEPWLKPKESESRGAPSTAVQATPGFYKPQKSLLTDTR